MKDDVLKTVSETIELASSGVEKLEKHIEAGSEPLRQNVFARFPILFTLSTTFGIVAVFFGFERMLQEISFLNNRPWLILLLGILILSITGTLYKGLATNKNI